MRIVFTLASLALLPACTIDQPGQATRPAAPVAVAAPAPAQPAVQPVAAKDDPNRKICRRMVLTGSNMPTNMCATAAEWAERDRIAQQGNDDMQRERQQGSRSFRGE